jgi:hypothetical protein
LNKDMTDTSHRESDLSQIMDPEKMTGRIWVDSELGAILRHQLNSPVGFDLGNMGHQTAKDLKRLCEADHLLVESFSTLFRHPNPPVKLLVLTRDFAKLHLLRSESLLPRKIARILYLTSIVVAMVKCGTRITKLDDAHIKEGLGWGLGHTWLDAEIQAIFREGLEVLRSGALQA